MAGRSHCSYAPLKRHCCWLPWMLHINILVLHIYECKAADSRLSCKVISKAISLWQESRIQTVTICRFMCSSHGFWHKVLGVLAFLVLEQESDNTRQQEQNVFLTNLLFQTNAGKMLTYQCVSLVQQNCWEQLRAPIHPQHCMCSLGSSARGPGSRLQLSPGAVDTEPPWWMVHKPWVCAGVLLFHPAGLLVNRVGEVEATEEVLHQ